MNTQSKLPKLYGAIVLVFPNRYLSSSAVELLPKYVESIEYPDYVEVVYRELDNVYSWEIDDLLTQLFASSDLDLLCKLIENYDTQILIDISFHHYRNYPVLAFEGQNMRIIHKLHANISIDPY